MVDSTIAHHSDFVKPVCPAGWFQYTSPSDMPREWVDEFFECVVDVSAHEEEAFLRFLARRHISLFVNLERKDIRMVFGQANGTGRGFLVSYEQMTLVCERFWETLGNREVTA